MKRLSALTNAAAVVLALSAPASAAAQAQSIARRIGSVENGMVRMSFASRRDVCGRGTSISTGSRNHALSRNGSPAGEVEWEYDCEHGPVRVVFDISGGSIREIRSYVGGKWRNGSASVIDLGVVSAREAAEYLVGLAASLPAKPGEKAIFPATLADSAEVWPGLVRIARDQNVPSQTRRQAVFWISQAAAEAATKDLADIAADNSVERSVREQAVFALSQRPKNQSVPALISVARTNGDPQIRRRAIFWLGQSNDARAVKFFEELLAKQ